MVRSEKNCGSGGHLLASEKPRAPSAEPDNKENVHDQSNACSRRRDGRQHFVLADCHWPRGKRPTAWHGSFCNLLQRNRAAAVRSRDAIPAFVLVSGIAGDI